MNDRAHRAFRSQLTRQANTLHQSESEAAARTWLARHRLYPLRAEPALADKLRVWIDGQAVTIARANSHLVLAFQELVLALDPIPVVPLKGVALLPQLYPEAPGLRLMRDLDLLVPAPALAQALSRIRRLGFVEGRFSRMARVINNERCLTRGIVVVELHHRLSYYFGRRSTWPDLALEPGVLHESNVYLLTPAQQLVYLLVHCLNHRPFSLLLWIDEILRLAATLSEMDRRCVPEIGRRMGAGDAVAAMVEILRRALGPDALAWLELGDLRRSSVRLRLGRKLALSQFGQPSILDERAQAHQRRFLSPLLAEKTDAAAFELARVAALSLVARAVQLSRWIVAEPYSATADRRQGLPPQPVSPGSDGCRLSLLSAELLQQGQTISLVAEGSSMFPTIRPGDSVTIAPSRERPRVGEIVAFHQPHIERLLIHRVDAIRGDAFATRGDANREGDGWVLRDQIYGRVIRVTRGENPVTLGVTRWPRVTAAVAKWRVGRAFLQRLSNQRRASG
jgi:hypothetical protein